MAFKILGKLKIERRLFKTNRIFRKSMANIILNGETSEISPLNIKNITRKSKTNNL